MKYIKNNVMEFLEIDDENMAIYDSDSGDTHYIDAIGMAILSLLDVETEEAELINQLCDMYDADREIITADVHGFLENLVGKKVVLEL